MATTPRTERDTKRTGVTTKRLTGKVALEAWPARLTEARLNPIRIPKQELNRQVRQRARVAAGVGGARV